MEEGGIRLDAPAELFGLYLNRAASSRDHVGLFVAHAWTQVVEPRPNLEIVETGFFPAEALPEGATDATRRRIAEIRENRPPATEW
jgi:hypothetical protein